MRKMLSVLMSALLSFTLVFSTGCSGEGAVTPKLRINAATNEWEVSYDNEQTWTSLGVKATGAQGQQGQQGQQGVTPKLRINQTTGEWEVSYDNEQTWMSLGVQASGGSGGNGNTDGGSGEDAYEPVIRFAVTSDVHLRRYDTLDGMAQLDKVYDTAYAFARDEDLNSGYGNLDGLFFVGDLVSYEYEYEYPMFFDYVENQTRAGTLARAVMGNHEFSKTVYSNSNGWSVDNIATATAAFKEASGYADEDYHAVINGYHFIFVSMDRYGKSSGTLNEYISSEKLAWLEGELDAALADDPTGEQPIFVFQHVHPQDTVAGSSNGDKYLKELLDNYSNVVDFSGHTHRPISDPRSIWQGTFTALNTGSMAYLNNPVGELDITVNAINANGEYSQSEAEHAMRDGGLYYICEVDENNVMRIFTYDTFTDSVFGEPMYLDSFDDPMGFTYKSYREDDAEPPEFEENAQITVLKNAFNRTDIVFPHAEGQGKDLVSTYRVEVYKGSARIKTEYRLSGVQFGNAMPENMNITVAGLTPNTTYTLKVYAINYWNKVSEPLVKEFTTASAATVTPDIASITFTESGGVDALGADVLQRETVATVLNNELERYVGSFNANGGYYLSNFADWFTTLKSGFTVELYVKVSAKPTSSAYALMSCHDDGGFRISYNKDGNYLFTLVSSVDTYTATGAGNVGEWAHVVGVYDTASLKLYVNGELAATTAVTGVYMPPRLTANLFMLGADPYYINSGLEYRSKSQIATANMYGYPLTATQVAQLYANV